MMRLVFIMKVEHNVLQALKLHVAVYIYKKQNGKSVKVFSRHIFFHQSALATGI